MRSDYGVVVKRDGDYIVRPKLNVPLTGNLDYTILVSFPANGAFYEKAL